MLSIVPTPGQYVSSLQQWQPLSTDEVELPDIEHLIVATLNVWFADDYFDQRCSATLALLQSYQPHVITLQEVTPTFLTQLLRTPWVQADYRLSDIYGDS